MSLVLVPVEANVQLSAKANIQHMCPFVHEVDNGTITITWDTDGWTIELHSLREYLATFGDREISHEALTQEVRDELGTHYGINVISVTSSWRTAGMEVLCSTSPTLVGQQ